MAGAKVKGWQVSVAAAAEGGRGYLGCVCHVGDTIYALGGTCGQATLLASPDGRSFHACAPPESTGLRAGLAGHDGRLWVVGEFGLIASTADEGATWATAASGTTGCLFSIARNPRGELLVAGDEGIVLVSRDEGATWTRSPVKISARIYRVVPGTKKDYFLRADGVLTSYGTGRRTVKTGVRVPLCDMARARNGARFLVGDENTCLVSHDRARTWEKVTLPLRSTWEAIARLGDDLLIVGARGRALLSTDDGATWKVLDTGTDRNLWSICPVDHGALVGGDSGLVLRLERTPVPVGHPSSEST